MLRAPLLRLREQHANLALREPCRPGTPSHLAGELLKQTAGIDFLIVQYKGTGAMLSDTVGGQVSMTIGSLPGLTPLVKAGKLRALGVSSAARAARCRKYRRSGRP